MVIADKFCHYFYVVSVLKHRFCSRKCLLGIGL